MQEQATFAPPLEKEQGRIDWSKSAFEISRQVRAFNPWPSAFTRYEGKLLKIHRAHAVLAQPHPTPGMLLSGGDEIRVATGDGVLILDELQLEGRKRLEAAEFSRGGGLRAEAVLGE